MSIWGPLAMFGGSLLGSSGLFGGGEGNYTDEQKEMFGYQADITGLMRDLMASRAQNEETFMPFLLNSMMQLGGQWMAPRQSTISAPGTSFSANRGSVPGLEYAPQDIPRWTPFDPFPGSNGDGIRDDLTQEEEEDLWEKRADPRWRDRRGLTPKAEPKNEEVVDDADGADSGKTNAPPPRRRVYR